MGVGEAEGVSDQPKLISSIKQLKKYELFEDRGS
jgi:hypothetical protein